MQARWCVQGLAGSSGDSDGGAATAMAARQQARAARAYPTAGAQRSVGFGSVTIGARVSVAAATMRPTTASSRASFESKYW